LQDLERLIHPSLMQSLRL